MTASLQHVRHDDDDDTTNGDRCCVRSSDDAIKNENALIGGSLLAIKGASASSLPSPAPSRDPSPFSFSWSDFPLLRGQTTLLPPDLVSAEDTWSDATTTSTSSSQHNCSHLLEDDVTTTASSSKSVRFSNILRIRTLPITLGDHPCCVGGMALTLQGGWQQQQPNNIDQEECILDLDLYEQYARRRTAAQLRMSYAERRERLVEATGWSPARLLQEEYNLLCQNHQQQEQEAVAATTPRRLPSKTRTPQFQPWHPLRTSASVKGSLQALSSLPAAPQETPVKKQEAKPLSTTATIGSTATVTTTAVKTMSLLRPAMVLALSLASTTEAFVLGPSFPAATTATSATAITNMIPKPVTVTATPSITTSNSRSFQEGLLAMAPPVFPQVSDDEGEDECDTLGDDTNDNDFIMEELNTAVPPALDLEGLSGDDDLHWFRFAGIGRLYEDQDTPEQVVLGRLKSATVAVIGMGGIGSWTAEALSRSGIGNLVLIDLDDICISNTNRQLHTLSTNVGSLKTEVMKERLLGINPYSNITLIHDFVMLDNVEDIMQSLKDMHVDVVIDAIDGQTEKTALMGACARHGFPIMSTGNSGGKSDPSLIVCRDLTQVHEDALLVSCREKLVTDFDFGPADASSPWRIPAVYSVQGSSSTRDDDNNDNLATSFRNEGSAGSACFVTGSFGFIAAARVVEMIVRQTLLPPKKP